MAAEHFDGDLGPPRSLLAPCILLLLAEGPGHGYQLMERLKSLGFDWNGPGPIYRELRALEAANLVTSSWSAPRAGPVPRVYQLTAAGRDALDRSAAGIIELQGLTAQYLTRYRKVAADPRSPSSEGSGTEGSTTSAPPPAAPPPRRRKPQPPR